MILQFRTLKSELLIPNFKNFFVMVVGGLYS